VNLLFFYFRKSVGGIYKGVMLKQCYLYGKFHNEDQSRVKQNKKRSYLPVGLNCWTNQI